MFHRICWNQDLKLIILGVTKRFLKRQSIESEWATRVIDSHSVIIGFLRKDDQGSRLKSDMTRDYECDLLVCLCKDHQGFKSKLLEILP